MKKLLTFFVAVLAIIGFAQAQDVYSSGYFTNSEGVKCAAVYKNGTKLYSMSTKSTSDAVVCDPNTGDVYWVDNSYFNDDTPNYGDVFKNATRYLSNPVNTGSHINGLYWETREPEQTAENCLMSVGYKTNENGKKYAAAWRADNNSDFWHPTMGQNIESEAFGVTSFRRSHGEVDYLVHLYCGYVDQLDGDHVPHATVWKWGSVLYTLSANRSYAYDVDYFNGDVYTVGIDWNTAQENYVSTVWKNDQVLYRLTSAMHNSRAWKIQVVGGDVFVCGWGTLRSNCIWKNGEPLYTYDASNTKALEVTPQGIYAAVTDSNHQGHIYKDGQVLYTPNNCEFLNDISVYHPCEETEVRTLPYFEGFEMGATDWDCWTIDDEDMNFSSSLDAEYHSFWHRAGGQTYAPATGDYCAYHRYNGAYEQEGWLISPAIYLQPNQDNTQLSFKTFEGVPNDMVHESVLISTTNTNPNSFTQIWQQTAPTASWKTVTISLDQYQGQVVYIAFKYAGIGGHNWLIDDISLEENYQFCSRIDHYPYNDDFSSDLICYNIVDIDHSGDQRNWKLNNNGGVDGSPCMYHPWGQSNMPQEGWAMTRPFRLSEAQDYTLTFKNKNVSSGPNMSNSVWIVTDNYDPVPSDFTMIWEASTFPTSWEEVSINLSYYAGSDVIIAFRYEGTYAHAWYIDDLSISQAIPDFNITVNANNASWGNVDGGGTYAQGSTCTITATPNNGYEFLKWTKNNVEISTNPSYTFTVTENATYTAIFGEHSVTYYTITTDANPAEAGSVEGGGVYPAGATAYLTATANTGWVFSHWNDGQTSNPRSITVNGDATYTANFIQEDYNITVVANPEEGGSVTGAGVYHYGDIATLTAVANEDYVFYSWNDGVTQSTRDITVVGDATYTAIFTTAGSTTYTITVLSGNPLLGTVAGGGVYPEGATIQIIAEPNMYAYFTSWDDGNTDNPREVTVTSDMTFVAGFESYQNYTITVESANPTMGEVEGGGNYVEGSEVVIRAIPYEGYYFISWDDGNAENPRTIFVTGDQTFKANFSENPTYSYTITTMCNPNQGSVYGGGTYSEGASVMLIALPNSGFEFDCWDDGNKDNPRNIVVTENKVYVAFFKSMGVDDNEVTRLVVYPNPAASVIHIAGLQANSEVSIYNAYGVLVKIVSADADAEIGISELAAGVYVARCGNAVVRFVKM